MIKSATQSLQVIEAVLDMEWGFKKLKNIIDSAENRNIQVAFENLGNISNLDLDDTYLIFFVLCIHVHFKFIIDVDITNNAVNIVIVKL